RKLSKSFKCIFFQVLVFAVLQFDCFTCITRKSSKSKPPQNAIIAIQIIDPHENKTDTKNSKRTIESSLGYGYQSNYVNQHVSPPKYEVYKYSQHDIPAYTPHQYNVQSNNYHVPSSSKPVQSSGISNFYQPGTVLFSTINQHGQLGELSQQFPGSLESQQYPIPVIILRVHPEQLANPLYPQLPQNHLHASAINSIDINSLLSSFIETSLKKRPVSHNYTPAQHQPVIQQQQIVYQQQYQPEPEHSSLHQIQNAQAYAEPQQETVQYQTPDQQYYPQYQYEEQQENVHQSYQSGQEDAVLPEPRIPDTSSNYQYNTYQVSSPEAYRPVAGRGGGYQTKDVLIDENYPSDKHTQVIFKRSKGKSSSRSRNKQAHRSATPNPPSTFPVSSAEPQVEEEKLKQPSPKYFQPNTNYYTIQYSEDQGYSHQKAPSYNREKAYSEDAAAEQNQNYVYVSSDPTYNQDV
ncbi:hypothetical protein NQ315_007895, partial [Exocentrus adspersus]